MKWAGDTCSTDLNPRSAVARTHMMKPSMLKLGSNPDATTMPRTTGTSARYVDTVSLEPIMTKPSAAVNSGVVAPIAWLKDTGIYFNEAFPRMIAMVKATDSTATCILNGRRAKWPSEANRCACVQGSQESAHLSKLLPRLNPLIWNKIEKCCRSCKDGASEHVEQGQDNGEFEPVVRQQKLIQ